MTADSEEPTSRIGTGTPGFRRATLALFSGGFATFAALYCVQPLLPVFTREFGLSPASSSVSLAVSTGILSIAMLGSSFVSDVVGRKATMVGALLLSSLLTLALAITTDWHQVIVLRGLTGLALSGFPAISIAYLADEMDRTALGVAVGLTISGNSIGGMGGRLIVSALLDLASWRVAMAAVGAACLLCTAILWLALPPSRHFARSALSPRSMVDAFGRHLRDPGMLMLFAEAFVLLGSFVAMYNYIGFRLLGPPFSLSQTVVGFVFLVYSVGTVSSSVMGPVANRIGRRTALWLSLVVMITGLALTIPDSLAAIVAGMVVFTIGFFAAHTVASSWVGLRAEGAKAQASSLYMLAYYMGSSVAGVAGGVFWALAGWPGVAALIGLMCLAGLALAVSLARTPPPAWLGATSPP